MCGFHHGVEHVGHAHRDAQIGKETDDDDKTDHPVQGGARRLFLGLIHTRLVNALEAEYSETIV